ncbi:MAG: tetratricopeptide repeat protein, partial [candidate division Zixibacteria bacterium]|nr:tetratricopeptide repeat protein [candidate division Zixibacteria bacterium]
MKPPPLPKCIRYLGHLGRGGTAEVGRVRVDGLPFDVALKYPATNDNEAIAAFRHLADRERLLIGDLEFPGLVRIIDHSELDAHYLLLELCEGPTLDGVGTTHDVQKVLDILSALALNLNFLNIHHRVHGDLKPQNVFLPASWSETGLGQLFYLKLSDFSLGRRLDESEGSRAGLGTVGYMAPETLTDEICDHRSDLFALGVIAWQLTTGHHPFIDPNDADPVRTNSRVCEAQPFSPGEVRSEVPKKVTELMAALMEKDPSNRPASGGEVCASLREAGAAYPYEKGLRPKHLMTAAGSYAEKIDQSLHLNSSRRQRLDRITNHDHQCLRMVLNANFLKGALVLKQDRFEFTRSIYRPHRLRRHWLNHYASADMGARRKIIQRAVVGDQTMAEHLGLFNPETKAPPDGLVEMILPLLKPSTVRLLTARFAPSAEKLKLYAAAARYYVQSGNLEGAERCAFQAAVALNKKHQNEAALRLLQSVIRYARLTDRTFEVRQLLMNRGDILKEIGDAAPAMAAYDEIIALYEGQPADKLLAETYKDMGDLYKIKQEPAAGLSALEKAMRIYSELGDELEISHTLNNIGNLHWVGADYPAALRSYRRALRIQRRHKAMDNVASTLSNIASILAIRGKLVRATRLFSLSIDICRETTNQLEEARILNNLGYVYHLRGMSDEAVDSLESSLEINRKIGTKKEILFNLENLTAIMIGAGQLRQSVKYLQEGMTLATELDDTAHLGAFTGDMGRTLKRMGRFSEAEALYSDAASLYEEVEDPIGRARLEISRADLRDRIGDAQSAGQIALETLKQRAAVNDKPQELEALLVLTRVTDSPEHLERARELVAELKLERERVVVEFNALSRALR